MGIHRQDALGDEFDLNMLRGMFCSICEYNTCDSCFVPEFTQFLGKMNKPEDCVLCRRQTPYRVGDSILTRRFYVEGVGQLCEGCFNQANQE